MSVIFYISLTWAIVFLILVSLISILVYRYYRKDNERDYGECFCKDYPKDAIEILKKNNYLK